MGEKISKHLVHCDKNPQKSVVNDEKIFYHHAIHIFKTTIKIFNIYNFYQRKKNKKQMSSFIFDYYYFTAFTFQVYFMPIFYTLLKTPHTVTQEFI